MAVGEALGPDIVWLRLTGEEAATLAVILAYIGGDEGESPRKHAEAILCALQDVGYYWEDGRAAEIVELAYASDDVLGVWFNPYPR